MTDVNRPNLQGSIAPQQVRQTLGAAFDAFVARNPLHGGLKSHVLANGLGGEARMQAVLRWLQIDATGLPGLDRDLTVEEKLLTHLFAHPDKMDSADLRRATHHRVEAWADLVAFARQVEAITLGYGE